MDLRLTKTMLFQNGLASLRSANRFMMAAGKRYSKEGCQRPGDKFVGHRWICPADDSKVQNREVWGQENHLRHGIYGHENYSVFVFLNNKACPYQDHCYTSCKINKYQAFTEARLIGKKGPCKPKLASVSLAVAR